MSTDQSIGMMDGAYFVGRKDILDWINGLLCTNLTKIEQTASGAIACQLLDSMFPGKVPMSKVNWSAKHDYEFIGNYKVLQTAFQKLHIEKHIEVDKLCRAKYQDNLEFMQWFKRFHELNDSGAEYDPVSVRARGKGGSTYDYNANGRSAVAPAARTTRPRPTTKERTVPRKAAPAPASKPTPAVSAQTGAQSTKQQELIEDLKTQIEEGEANNAELKLTVDGLEKERDFYFGKLRDIEILLQSLGEDHESNALIAKIFKILYATEDESQVEEEETDGAQDDTPETAEETGMKEVAADEEQDPVAEVTQGVDEM